MAILIAIILSAFVFWLVAHVSIILAVIAALIVLAVFISSPVGYHGGYRRW